MRELAPLWLLRDVGAAGTSIFEEGDAGDAFFVLLQGKVVVQKGAQALATLDAEALSGGVSLGRPFFGEFALLDRAPRFAGVRARTPCSLLVLERRHFSRFVAMVTDFRGRLRDYKELRVKQNELEMANASDATAALRRARELEEEEEDEEEDEAAYLRASFRNSRVEMTPAAADQEADEAEPPPPTDEENGGSPVAERPIIRRSSMAARVEGGAATLGIADGAEAEGRAPHRRRSLP